MNFWTMYGILEYDIHEQDNHLLHSKIFMNTTDCSVHHCYTDGGPDTCAFLKSKYYRVTNNYNNGCVVGMTLDITRIFNWNLNMNIWDELCTLDNLEFAYKKARKERNITLMEGLKWNMYMQPC